MDILMGVCSVGQPNAQLDKVNECEQVYPDNLGDWR
jgi:hypothetical protein